MKKSSFNFLFFIFFFSVLSIFTSCKADKRAAKPQKEKIVIGFSIDTLIVERWRQDCDIFINTARKKGAEVIIKDAFNSVQEQIKQIEELIAQNVDVLVIVPKEAKSLTAVLDKAKSKKIPVISYDRRICDADIDLYMSVDSKKVGNLMADAIINQKTEGGIWCILGPEQDNNMLLVAKGVQETLKGSKISVEYNYFTPDWNYDLAYKKMDHLLNQRLVPTAVICGNDAIAENVLRAIGEHRLGNNIPVVAQDAEILACRRVAQGIQAATVYKPISKLAQIAAEYACFLAKDSNYLREAKISDKIDNGYMEVPSIFLEPVLVTQENLKKTVVDSGFHTYQEIYR